MVIMAGVVILFLIMCAAVAAWADHRIGAPERRIVAGERRVRWEDTRV